uniref:Uncharacterized LOC103185940 n=1 Tax=Callorhinchus milii TaxID=7868 RepID=A0A4W3H454_CALMI|eukprot:gi/632972920/ref/XP_007902895.1/ PREDICTED: uncharacterized protein LOC103185940 [Callorhinchus milii]
MLAILVFHRLCLIGIISKVAGRALIEVTQYPEHQAVSRGTDVKLYCAFPFPDPNSYAKVHWWKQGESQYLHRRPDKRKIFGFDSKACGLFQLLDATLQDSGVYHCTLSIQGEMAGNGTGSQLTVCVPPDPLKIDRTAPQKNSSATLTLVCKTAAFYPENLTLTWYKNGTEITTGIITTKQQNTDGLYEVSSSLEETQPVQSGLVYTCRVSHLIKQTAEIAYIVPPPEAESKGKWIRVNYSYWNVSFFYSAS